MELKSGNRNELAWRGILGCLLMFTAQTAVASKPQIPMQTKEAGNTSKTLHPRSDSVPPNCNASARLIPFQAYFTDAAGKPVEGVNDLTFRIFDLPTGGEPFSWTELHANTPVNKGMVNVILGCKTPFSSDSAVSFDQELYIEVQVDSNTPMVPRQQIVPAIHAYEASHASSADTATRALNGWIPGEIKIWPGRIGRLPSGWEVCDGRAVSSSTYPELFANILQAWGAGEDDADPATDFNLPELRGRFLRGVNDPSNGVPEYLRCSGG